MINPIGRALRVSVIKVYKAAVVIIMELLLKY
jgi:hypothetical protein